MTVPSWPSVLPRYVLMEGFSYGYGDGRLKTPTETGPGKVGRRFSAVGKPVEAQIIIDRAKHAILENFWEIDTAGGTLPFWMPNQLYETPIVDENGEPLLPEPEPAKGMPWLCRFGDQPPRVVAVTGKDWRVAFSLTVLP